MIAASNWDGELLGERGHGQREQRDAAHREHVVERVRGGDRAEVGRVVDDGREEVDREHERSLVVEAVDRGVVGRIEPDEQVLRVGGNEPGEQLLQSTGRVLRRAAAGDGQAGQLHRLGARLHAGHVSCLRAAGPPVQER